MDEVRERDYVEEIGKDVEESSENRKQYEPMIGDNNEQAFKTSPVINVHTESISGNSYYDMVGKNVQPIKLTYANEKNSEFIKVEYRDTNGNVTRTKKVNVGRNKKRADMVAQKKYNWSQQQNNKKIPQGNIRKGQAMRGHMNYRNDKGVSRVEYRPVNVGNIDKRNVTKKNVMEGNRKGDEKNTSRSLENCEERNVDIEDVMEDVTHNGKCIENNEIVGMEACLQSSLGIGTKDKQEEVRKLIMDQQLSICTFIEARPQAKDVDIICSKIFGVWNLTSNMVKCRKGYKIMLEWNNNIVKVEVLSMTWQLWKDLSIQKTFTNGYPWALLWDFKITLSPNEHSVGGSDVNQDMQDFQDCVNLVKIEDISMLIIPGGMRKQTKPFRFANYIADKQSFIQTVEDRWKEEINATKMFQSKFDNDPNNNEVNKEGVVVLKEYKELMQKTKIDSLKEGDMNTTYFHKVLKSKQNKNRIESIYDENRIRYEGDQVPGQFVKHFQMFLGKEVLVKSIEDMDDLFTCTLTNEEALLTVKEVVEKDICEAIKDFFFNGKLLKEINSTIISLVPKEPEVLDKTGKLPMKYLGVPLLANFLGVADYKSLVDKVKAKFGDWKNKLFPLPKIVVNEIDKVLKGFLWNQSDSFNGKAKLAWKVVCRPKKSRIGVAACVYNIWWQRNLRLFQNTTKRSEEDIVKVLKEEIRWKLMIMQDLPFNAKVP
ncbi:hypothetical protein Tco_0823857, partial [Tanacetum coccineum]